MKIKNSAMALAFVAAGLGSAPVLAAEAGGYLGVAAGQTMADIDGDAITADLASIGLGANTTVDDTDVGFKIFGGYRFNRNFAVEGGYTNFGKFTFTSNITSGGSGTVSGDVKGYSLNASALGILPFNESFEVFGRAGLSLWDIKATLSASGPGGSLSDSESESGVSPLLGLGATFNAGSKFGIRVEFERHFDVGDEDTTGSSDVDLISVGVLFRF